MNRETADFNLADLTTYETHVLDDCKEEVRGFIIALGCVYNDFKDNDFKDNDWMNHQLSKIKPENTDIVEPFAGQWSGMNIYIVRQYACIFYEFFELVKKNKMIFDEKIIKETEVIMGSDYGK